MKPLLVWVTPGFGMFFGTLLSAWLIKPLGVRKLVPVALYILLQVFIGIMAVSIIRFIQGLSCGTVLPVIGSMTANWATLKEQYCFIVFGHLFVQLVPLACWPFSSWLLKLEFTLPFIFYATIAVIFAAVWVLFYRDRPQYHRLVNGLELNKIVTGKIKAISNRSVKKKSLGMVISSLPVWAVWISAFSYFVVIALILQYLPIYCHIILKMEDPTPEIAMAFSLMLIMTLLYPIWIRIARKSGEKMSISLFNLISFIVIGVAFIFIGLSPKNSVISRGAFIVTLIALVLSFYGFYRSAIFVGRYYAKYIISYAENSFAVAFIFVSFLVYFLDNPEGFNEWRVVFITVSLVQFITAAVFCILGSWKPEEWSKQTWNPSVGRRLVSVDQIDFHNEECGFIEMKII
uniref:MFS domain-containing protein n=1 Tax=Syphacia muris TaxID=451379 RepID=A0A0N5AIR3_9BILA